MDLCSCVGLSFSGGDVMCSKIVQRLCWLCREGRDDDHDYKDEQKKKRGAKKAAMKKIGLDMNLSCELYRVLCTFAI